MGLALTEVHGEKDINFLAQHAPMASDNWQQIPAAQLVLLAENDEYGLTVSVHKIRVRSIVRLWFWLHCRYGLQESVALSLYSSTHLLEGPGDLSEPLPVRIRIMIAFTSLSPHPLCSKLALASMRNVLRAFAAHRSHFIGERGASDQYEARRTH